MRMKFILIIYSLTPPEGRKKYIDKFFLGQRNSVQGSPYILGATCRGRFMVGEPWPGKFLSPAGRRRGAVSQLPSDSQNRRFTHSRVVEVFKVTLHLVLSSWTPMCSCSNNNFLPGKFPCFHVYSRNSSSQCHNFYFH